MARGVRGASQSNHSTYPNSHRAGINKRSPAPRTEKDGDLLMDGAEETGRSSRAIRHGRHTPRGAQRAHTINPRNLAKAIAHNTNNSNQVNMRDVPRGPRRHSPPQQRNFENYDQIIVRGWIRSEAARNTDQGIPQLISFIERKASRDRNLKVIQEYQVRGDNLFIYSKEEDREKILRLNNYQFARATLSVELKREAKVSTTDVKATLRSMILRRYNEAGKLLDLSALASDPDLIRLNIFATEERASKITEVLASICEGIWPNNWKRNNAVQSLSFANGNIASVTQISTFSQTFPKIRTLDLSNNKLEDHKALEPWSRKFRQLDNLILRGNNIENIPDFHVEIMNWFPKLCTLDDVQIRQAVPVGQQMVRIPVAAAVQEDIEIAESFVSQFFPAFDENRSLTVVNYYANTATFTMNIKNRSAGNYDKTSWDKWLGMSRNLTKITSPHGQNQRFYHGFEELDKCFSNMPIIRHPVYTQEREKYLMECKVIEGLPDPTSQAPYGVNGILIDVHGEFEEINSDNQITAKRSFDRKFVLGPGEEVGSIRILKDMLTIRPYSGTDSFKPTVSPQVQAQPDVTTSVPEITLNPAVPEATVNTFVPDVTVNTSVPEITVNTFVPEITNNGVEIPDRLKVPAGFGTPMPDKSPEQLQKELLILEFCGATGMNVEYSVQCLEQNQWDFATAGEAFMANQDKIPSDAYY